jgi:hypothetical protein
MRIGRVGHGNAAVSHPASNLARGGLVARHRVRNILPMLVALIAATLIVAGCPAAAQTAAPSFGVKAEPGKDPAVTAKGYFIFKADAGQAVFGKLRLTNPTNEAVAIDLAAVDARTASNGGSAFAQSAEPNAVGAWLALKETTVTLKPGADQLVAFAVKVPKDAKPGQYLAGLAAIEHSAALAATPTTAATGQAGASVDVRTRYVIAVEIDVPGDWPPSLRITGAALLDQPSGRFLGIALTNDGAAFLRPSGTITVTNADGKTILAQKITLGTFVTGTSIVYPIAWPDNLASGQYHVAVELAYGKGLTASYAGDVTAE